MAIQYEMKIQYTTGRSFNLKPCGRTNEQRWDTYQKSLSIARKNNAIVTCTCAGRGPRRLTIRLRGETHHPAKYALSGSEHHPLCNFYTSPPEDSGQQAYEPGVIKSNGNGRSEVRLRFGLKEGEPKKYTGIDYQPNKSRQGRVLQRSMTLLGLLHLLWTEARFNIWHPNMEGKRWPTTIHKYLREAAGNQRIGGHRLTDHLLLPANSKGNVEYGAQNKKLVKEAVSNKRRLIIISELRPFGPKVDLIGGKTVPMNYFDGFPYSNISEELVADVRRKFSAEMNAWQRGCRTIAIVFVDKPKQSQPGNVSADVCEMALMRVSEDWIPLDSDLEEEVELALRKRKRFFEKPLRFDASEEDVFPDFVLFDVEGVSAYPMEVFGMDTPEYRNRKSEKRAYYRKRYGDNWWEWDKTTHYKLEDAAPFPANDESE